MGRLRMCHQRRDADAGEGEASVGPVAHGQPLTVSAETRAKHSLSGHAVYKPWYACCVANRARRDGHHRVKTERSLPIIAFDYAYLGSDEEDEERPGEYVLLCARDCAGKGVYGYLLPAKGTSYDLVEVAVRAEPS